MPIRNTLDVVVQEDDLVVLGPPTAVDVALDIGPQGPRGSTFFTGDGNPNLLTIDQFANIHGRTPVYGDIYLNIDSTGTEYGKFYSYATVPGNDQWSPVIDLLQTMDLFFTFNEQAADSYYSYISASAVLGSASAVPQLRFDQNKRLVNAENIPINISASQVRDFDDVFAATIANKIVSNVENGINVFYDPITDKINFDVDDFTITLTGDLSGSGVVTNLANVSINAQVQDNSHNHVSTNISDFQEAVEDVVGDMVSGNTELGIAVTYNDFTGKLNFDVNDFNINLIGDVTGSGAVTNLQSVNLVTQVRNDSHFHSFNTIIDADEYIEDVVGAMVSNNTEQGISVTYADFGPTGRGKLNFDVNDFTITFTGDVFGTANINNLSSTTVPLTVSDNSHNHDPGTITDFVENVQDAAAELFNHPFHTNISVNYDDVNNRIFLIAQAQEGGGGGGGGGEGNLAYTWWFGV